MSLCNVLQDTVVEREREEDGFAKAAEFCEERHGSFSIFLRSFMNPFDPMRPLIVAPGCRSRELSRRVCRSKAAIRIQDESIFSSSHVYCTSLHCISFTLSCVLSDTGVPAQPARRRICRFGLYCPLSMPEVGHERGESKWRIGEKEVEAERKRRRMLMGGR